MTVFFRDDGTINIKSSAIRDMDHYLCNGGDGCTTAARWSTVTGVRNCLHLVGQIADPGARAG